MKIDITHEQFTAIVNIINNVESMCGGYDALNTDSSCICIFTFSEITPAYIKAKDFLFETGNYYKSRPDDHISYTNADVFYEATPDQIELLNIYIPES
jgi:hypothetical protein